MNKLTNTLSNTCIAFAILISVNVSAQSADVYTWAGGSGSWHNAKNWLLNQQTTNAPPDQNDIVHIQCDSSIEIDIEFDAFAKALSISGNGTVAFNSNGKVDLKVYGSCILTENSSFADNISLNLEGNSEASYYYFPDRLSKQFSTKSKNTYVNLLNLPKAGGSCPYFTIVSNPTAPTCNGFNNGVASVEAPTDGTGPFSYQWIGGPATREWNNVGAGTYTIIIFDLGQGLPCNTDVFVNEPGPLTVFSMNTTPPLCAGVCDGTASPIVIGGNGGYILNWSSGETGLNPTMLCPVFSLNITDQMGCVYDTTFTYPNPPDNIVFDANITNVDCFGNNNGAIDVSITGGTGVYITTWSGPNGFASNNESISNLEPGDYFVQAEDENSCLGDTMFTITENPVLTATSTKVENICADGAAGSINITPTGGAQPYSFAWTGPSSFTSTAQNLTNLISGLYEVTITDASLCTFTLQTSITEPAEIAIDIVSADVLCAGGNTGSATASASGGTPGYTYNWEGPNAFSSAGPGIANIEAGMYVLTVSDINFCIKEDTVFINQPDSLEISFTSTELTCNAGNDGTINSTISGGNAPYTISWTGPGGFTSSDANLVNLSAGIYTLTITDFNNCELVESVELSDPQSIVLSADITPSLCSNGTDGEIDLTVEVGNEPYTYQWTGPNGYSNNNEDIFNLGAGSYTIDVTDASSCAVSATYNISAPDALSATFTTTHVSCFGLSDGAISIVPSGGVGPYTFLWVGPSGFVSTNQNHTDLLAGTYSVQITDNNGCAGFFDVTLNQPPKINITGPITHVTCFDGSNGAIDALINGGTPGYTYAWSGPNGFTASTQDITAVPAGVYTLTVTDAILCSKSRNYTINEPAAISVQENITDVTCGGYSDGSISIAASNGVAPYTYAWTGPAGFISGLDNISDLIAGTYNLTVTDDNSCTRSFQYDVNETVNIILNATVTDVSCFGDSNGAISINVQGGVEPYNTTWNGPDGYTSNDLSIANLTSGTYELTLTDDGGCTQILTENVGSPDELTLNITEIAISCFGNADGSHTANISGGTAPFSYDWTGPNGFSSTLQTISALDSGLYSLTITDSNDCTVSGSGHISEPAQLEVDIDVTQPGCLTDDGVLTAIPAGGTVTTNYTYTWENSAGIVVGTTATISNLGPDDYTIIITDDNSCSTQQTIELSRITFNVIAAASSVSCFGNVDGHIQITPTNGTEPFTISWTGPDGFTASTLEIDNLTAGQYDMVLEDATGCLLNVVYDIDEPEEINFDATVIPESCPDESDGSIELEVSGGSPGYLISWSGPDGFISNSSIINDLSPGNYLALVTDVNGCTNDTLINIAQADDFGIALTPTNPICAGELTGNITADAFPNTGSPGVFTFSWTGPDGFNSNSQNISDLDAGVYIVLVTSEAGCVKQDSVELIMPDSIQINLSVQNSNCLLADGSASVIISGGAGALAVRWLDAAGNELATGLEVLNLTAGIYAVEVSDESGCTLTQTVAISDNSGSITGIVQSAGCTGSSEGAIDITVAANSPPFTFQWANQAGDFSTDEDISGLLAGEYNVTVTDNNGCIFTASFTVNDNPEIEVEETTSKVTCQGGDGSISLEISNASTPTTVTWVGPNGFSATGATITDLEVGIYDYSIVDNGGCTNFGSVEVITAEEILAGVDIENVLCGGESTGSIDLTVSGGNSPFSYSWTSTQGFTGNNQDITDIPADTYTVVITDANNCTLSETYTIDQNTPIQAAYSLVHPDCAANNGSISVTLSGGVVSTNYFIMWSDLDGNAFPSTADLTDLGIGTYSFFASDDNGCSVDTSIILSNPSSGIEITQSNETCVDANDGSIELEITDVEAPFTVEWAGPDGFTSLDEDVFGLAPGDYQYTITSFSGCEYVNTVSIESAEPIAILSQIGNSCFGVATGSITLDVNGQHEPFTFEWTGPNGFVSDQEDISDLEAGNYQVTIIDAISCSSVADFEVFQSTEIGLDIIISEITCSGDSTGTIDLTISGGHTPYTISWIGPDNFVSTSFNLTDLKSGEYMLQVTDSLGCTADSIFTLNQPEPISVTETVISAGCETANSLGSVEVLVSGGIPGYTISWTGPNGFTSIDFILTDLQPGTYTYVVSDENGCESANDIEIFDVEPVEISISTGNILCVGQSNGQASAQVTGGMAPYQISWLGPGGFSSSDLIINDLAAGNYILTVSDSAGCSNAESISIIEPDSIEITVAETLDANCNTSSDGSISITVEGGFQPYEFEWTGRMDSAPMHKISATWSRGIISCSY